MPYYTYILASKPNGTLYTGVTSDIVNRTAKHRDGTGSRFTSKYSVHRLVYYEVFEDVRDAIQREKNIKRYYRQWKVNLIEQDNSDWRDLSADFTA
ncbi:MAG: GIY-YIG nuclease family protein [Anderseniella sp.]|nr:GIY-YIG nuclease family protein [Anderseniella sp.]